MADDITEQESVGRMEQTKSSRWDWLKKFKPGAVKKVPYQPRGAAHIKSIREDFGIKAAEEVADMQKRMLDRVANPGRLSTGNMTPKEIRQNLAEIGSLTAQIAERNKRPIVVSGPPIDKSANVDDLMTKLDVEIKRENKNSLSRNHTDSHKQCSYYHYWEPSIHSSHQ